MTKKEKLAVLEDMVGSVVEAACDFSSLMVDYKTASNERSEDYYQNMRAAEDELRNKLMTLVEAVVGVDA